MAVNRFQTVQIRALSKNYTVACMIQILRQSQKWKRKMFYWIAKCMKVARKGEVGRRGRLVSLDVCLTC